MIRLPGALNELTFQPCFLKRRDGILHGRKAEKPQEVPSLCDPLKTESGSKLDQFLGFDADLTTLPQPRRPIVSLGVQGMCMYMPWEPTTFIFRGYNSYNQYLKGLKPSFFMVLGSKGVFLKGHPFG